MCEPVTLATLAVASTAMSEVGKRQAAAAQFGANAAQRKAQNEEIAAKAGQKAGERVKQAQAEQARLLVAAGEAGVGGQSTALAIADPGVQADFDVADIGANAAFEDRASEARFLSANASVDNPTALSTGLALVTAGVSGYATGKSLEV